MRHDTTGYIHNPQHRWHYYPGHDPRRGDRVQSARQPAGSWHGAWRTPPSPIPAARRARRPGPASKRAVWRSSYERAAAVIVRRGGDRDGASACRRSPIPTPDLFADNLELLVDSINDGSAAERARASPPAPGCWRRRMRKRIEVSHWCEARAAIVRAAGRTAGLPHRPAALGHDLFPVPVRPRAQPADDADLGRRQPCPPPAADPASAAAAARPVRRAAPAAARERMAGHRTASTSPIPTDRRNA